MLTPTEAIWKRWNLYSTKTPAACSESMYMQVLYHLQKVSENPGGIRLLGLSRGQRNILKGSPVLPDGMFQTEIRVPFLQSRLWYQSQALAFAAVFWQMELIWANGKRDSGKKFTTPEFSLPFTSLGSKRDLGWFGEFPQIENSILVLAVIVVFISIMQITFQNCALSSIFYSRNLKKCAV